MDLVFDITTMEINMLEIMSMMFEVEKEFINSLMAIAIMEIGSMEKQMEKVY